MTFFARAIDSTEAFSVAAFLNCYGIITHLDEKAMMDDEDGVDIFVLEEDYTQACELINISSSLDNEMDELA